MREFFKQAMKMQTEKISEGCSVFVFDHPATACPTPTPETKLRPKDPFLGDDDERDGTP